MQSHGLLAGGQASVGAVHCRDCCTIYMYRPNLKYIVAYFKHETRHPMRTPDPGSQTSSSLEGTCPSEMQPTASAQLLPVTILDLVS